MKKENLKKKVNFQVLIVKKIKHEIVIFRLFNKKTFLY